MPRDRPCGDPAELIGSAADPQAQAVCLQSWQTYERLGSPEGELAIAQAVTYIACAPKSNAVYMAFKAAKADIANQPSFDVPLIYAMLPPA